jgi:TPP-dependent indolepyruvate ferredoxin oxidoreductase alpha subunit
MTEPTIDEMLQLLDAAHSHLIAGDSELYVDQHYDGTLARTIEAIRAILEEYREYERSAVQHKQMQCDKCMKVFPDTRSFLCSNCDADAYKRYAQKREVIREAKRALKAVEAVLDEE